MLEPYIIEKAGKKYMYRCTSHYSAEKHAPVSETEYMGTVVDGKLRPKKGYSYNEETGEFKPIVPKEPSAGTCSVVTTKRFGDAYLLDALQKRMGILDDLVRSFGDRDGRLVMAYAMAYCINPAAMQHMESVIGRRAIPELLGIDPDTDFSSQRVSELTKRIGKDTAAMDDFFRCRITGTEGEYVFDLTSESTYSSRNPQAEWGRNKDHLKLRQVNLGLVTDKRGRPLMFYTYPGSVADITTLRRMVTDVRRLGGGDATLVMDRGFVSPGSVMYLLDNRMDFVIPMVLSDNSLMRALITESLKKVGSVEHTHVHNGHSYTVHCAQMGVRVQKEGNTAKRNTVWEDPDGYDLVLEGDDEYGSCEGYLDVFVYRDVESAGAETAGMDVALEGIINDAAKLRPRNPAKAFARIAGKYASLLEWSLDDSKHLVLKVRQNAHTFAANRKGIFVMITPAGSGRDWRQVLECYDCRDVVEDAFLEDKSEGDGRTPRSGDTETIRGRTLIRMVSLIMTMEMIAESKEYGGNPKVKAELKPRGIGKRTPRMYLDSLGNVEMIYGDGWKQMTEVTKDDRLIFRMFDVGPPKGSVK
ncbi:MAG: transposase [archaeon]|nr:transposase [archaeon]